MGLMNGDNKLLNEISSLIEQSRRTIYAQASSATVLLFWEIGRRINADVLENKRAGYGKQIVSKLSTQLTEKYGRSFAVRNLRRMMQFVEQFPDFKIVSHPATQLSWACFIEILPLKIMDAKIFYLNEAARGRIGRNGIHKIINRKAYVRREIADTQISTGSSIPLRTFKDPYCHNINNEVTLWEK
jgi:hypothetical protein